MGQRIRMRFQAFRAQEGFRTYVAVEGDCRGAAGIRQFVTARVVLHLLLLTTPLELVEGSHAKK